MALRAAARMERGLLNELPTETLEGIEVVDWEEHDAATQAEIFKAVGHALNSVRTAFPVGFRRILRSLDYVIVEHAPGYAGYYCSTRQAAVLDLKTVLQDGWPRTAMVIVHECTHAELRSKGFGYGRDRRTQIERICRKRELAFLRACAALGEADGIDRWITWREKSLDRPALTDRELWRLSREKDMASLRRLNVPEPLVRSLEWIVDMRLRKIPD